MKECMEFFKRRRIFNPRRFRDIHNDLHESLAAFKFLSSDDRAAVTNEAMSEYLQVSQEVNPRAQRTT